MDAPLTTAAGPDPRSWFEKRPIPVFVIAALCLLQFLGVVLFIWDHWADLVEMMRRGIESPVTFLFRLVYPFLLLAAGLTLLALRKAALVFFGAYLVWGVEKIIVQTLNFPGYLSLAMVFGVLVYCLRLAKEGVLR